MSPASSRGSRLAYGPPSPDPEAKPQLRQLTGTRGQDAGGPARWRRSASRTAAPTGGSGSRGRLMRLWPHEHSHPGLPAPAEGNRPGPVVAAVSYAISRPASGGQQEQLAGPPFATIALRHHGAQPRRGHRGRSHGTSRAPPHGWRGQLTIHARRVQLGRRCCRSSSSCLGGGSPSAFGCRASSGCSWAGSCSARSTSAAACVRGGHGRLPRADRPPLRAPDAKRHVRAQHGEDRGH